MKTFFSCCRYKIPLNINMLCRGSYKQLALMTLVNIQGQNIDATKSNKVGVTNKITKYKLICARIQFNSLIGKSSIIWILQYFKI